MEAIRVTKIMEKDGEILVAGLPFKKGQEVEVIIQAGEAATGQPLTARRLLESGLVGLWKERKDIGDSAEFARRLREQAQRRQR